MHSRIIEIKVAPEIENTLKKTLFQNGLVVKRTTG